MPVAGRLNFRSEEQGAGEQGIRSSECAGPRDGFDDVRQRSEVLDEIRSELLRNAQYRYVALHAVAFAHEVRNPLHGVALSIELLLAEEPEHSERRASLQEMLRYCERATATTTEFLQQARAPHVDPLIEQHVDALCGRIAQPAAARGRRPCHRRRSAIRR